MQNHNVKFKSDLKVRCYKFSINIIGFLDSLPLEGTTRILSNQLLRSATSVGANLVEAHASSSRLEFKKYNEIALKSANESKYWLGLLRDTCKADRPKVNNLLSELNEIANMIASGILKLKGKK